MIRHERSLINNIINKHSLSVLGELINVVDDEYRSCQFLQAVFQFNSFLLFTLLLGLTIHFRMSRLFQFFQISMSGKIQFNCDVNSEFCVERSKSEKNRLF